MRLLRHADCYGPANTEDVWKCVALVLMTVDHIGLYLFPEQLWWRVMGRAAFPIWLFFVGYNMASAAPSPRPVLPNQALWLLVCTGWVGVLDVIGEEALLPFSILLTILLLKWLFSYEKAQAFIGSRPFVLCLLGVLCLPITHILEYGGMGLLFAALGFRVGRGLTKEKTQIVAFVTVVLHTLIENSIFTFNQWQEIAAAVAVFLVILPLLELKLRVVSWLPLQRQICFLARNSLLYYVLHLTALQLLALALFK